MQDLRGKTAVAGAAGSGIGRALAAAVERDLGDVDLLCSNVGGTFNMIKAFVPKMRKRGKGGHVTLTSSAAGLHVIANEHFGAYAAAKMAVVGLGEDPADDAKIMIRGIRDNAPYIFTRLGDRATVERRFNAMLADFDRWERVIPELHLGPTRTDPQ